MMRKGNRRKQRWSLLLVVAIVILFLVGAGVVHNMDEQIGKDPITALNEDRSQELVTGVQYTLNLEQEQQYQESQQQQEERIQEQKEQQKETDPLPEVEKEKPKDPQQPETTPDSNPQKPEDGSTTPDPESKPDQGEQPGGTVDGEDSEGSSAGTGDGDLENPDNPDTPINPDQPIDPDQPAKPDGPGEEDGIDKTPSISVKELTDQMTVEGTYFEFSLKALDYQGRLIDDYSKVFVYLNQISESSRISGRDVTAQYRNYRVDDLEEGNNTIYIIVEDSEGNRASKQYTVRADLSAEVKVIGTLHLRIDISSIGLGTLLNVDADIYKGDGVAHVVQRALTENGFRYDHTGNASNTWYLVRIKKAGITKGFQIPDDILAELEADGATIMGYDDDSLGEKDFYEGSGWVYSLNGKSPNVGMGARVAEDGDDVLLKFILK